MIFKYILCFMVCVSPALGQSLAPSTAAGTDTSSADSSNAPAYLGLYVASTSVTRTDGPGETGVGVEPATNGASPARYGQQTKRILCIVPNFNAISAGSHLPPESAKGKFMNATEDSFDYSSFIWIGILAGLGQAQDSYPEFHQGAAGYGRYYWHYFVDQTSENYFVETFMPILFRQDTRYYTLGRGRVLNRIVYSMSRAFITRTDAGAPAPNFSEVIGAGAAAGLSNLYYPDRERTWTKTGQRWVTNVGLDVLTGAFKEFWPDINRKVFHEK